MRLAIIGGALQGTEVCYLAKEAGLHTLVIDRDPHAPALDLADEAVIMDVTKDRSMARELLETCDAVLPANENQQALDSIMDICEGTSTEVMFDPSAYNITSSKLQTQRHHEEARHTDAFGLARLRLSRGGET